jgi:hypothetical protein
MILRTLVGRCHIVSLPANYSAAIVPATLGFESESAPAADLTGLWVATRSTIRRYRVIERGPHDRRMGALGSADGCRDHHSA